MQVFFNSDGTSLTAYITIIDTSGAHVDPDSWPITNDPAIVLSSHPSAAKTVTAVDTGVYKAVWTGLSPALSHGDVVHISIDGAISGTAWSTWIVPIQVVLLPPVNGATVNANVASMDANTLTASALASDATQEIGDAFLSHVITKGDPGSIERAFWQVTKAAASFDGTVQTSVSNTASSFLTDIAIDDFAGQVLVLVDGALAGEARAITSVVSGVVTVHDAFTGVPADGVNFLVLPQQVYSISQIQNGLATSSGVTSAFTEIKGAGWSSDTDTLVEIAAGGGAGSGSGSFTINLVVKLSNGNTVGDCDVSLTTSSTSSTTNLIATGRTDPNGNVTFQLDSGVFYVWRQKLGVNFDDPAVLTVAGDGSATVS